MSTPIYQVDAFASRLFAGNPAAVCPLESWPDDARMQSIAAENNLAETAFFVRSGDCYRLRWFSPLCEIGLCGHATLASAYVIFERLDPSATRVRFETLGGELTVTRAGDLLSMDFPAVPAKPCQPNAALTAALGKAPRELWEARDYVAVYDSEDDVLALAPDMQALAAIGHFATIATAPGKHSDFVSRFFAPAVGVPEDPVTGSAHCTLAPYWSERLGKTSLYARQVSQRGGELWVEHRGDRTGISGHAVLYLEGTICG